jgi:transketolase
MGAALNGMNLFGGLIAYGGTFLIFSDYMKPAIRIAAISSIPSIFVFTHDSVGLGEDGPTHQPIEHLAALRAVPNLTVIRPADANEVSRRRVALASPTALAAASKCPTLRRLCEMDHGACVEDFSENPQLILMASVLGEPVYTAVALTEGAARVVSFQAGNCSRAG